MLSRAWVIALKDLRLSVGGQGLVQAVLLGLLLIFLFSLSRPAGEPVPPQSAAAIFWLASAFGLVLVVNDLFALEEANGARLGLLSAPLAPQAIWLGKGLAGFCLLLLSQAVFLPASVVFLGQDMGGEWWLAPVTLFTADLGLVALGTLLGALSQGQAARESLLSVILFPLLLPVLLGGIKLFTQVFAAQAPDLSWLGLMGAFDALFAGTGLILFQFVYTGEE